MPVKYWRYAAIYLLTSVALTVIFIGIETFTGQSAPSGVASILPPAIAAMLEGLRIARTKDGRPASGQMWKAALSMTAVALVVGVALFVVSVALMPELMGLLSVFGPIGWLVVLACLCVLTLCINRAFFAMGFQHEAQAQAHREAD